MIVNPASAFSPTDLPVVGQRVAYVTGGNTWHDTARVLSLRQVNGRWRVRLALDKGGEADVLLTSLRKMPT